MPVRAFISSRMESNSDSRLRQAAIEEVRALGHEPVFFEGLPGRSLPEGRSPLDQCKAMVRSCSVLLAIVDDVVTEAMEAELAEASRELGKRRIFYYFLRSQSRDSAVKALWSEAKSTHVLKEFSSEIDLRAEIRKSIGSFIEDSVAIARGAPIVLHEDLHLVNPGYYIWVPIDLRRRDRIVATCDSAKRFYAVFVDRPGFSRFRNSGGELWMPLGSDKVSFTEEITATRNGEWFVVVKRGALSGSPALVSVKVVKVN